MPADIAKNIIVTEDKNDLSRLVAIEMAELVHNKPTAVFGLATGSTPLGVYNLLSEWKVDFSKATFFNLDEYYPIPKTSPQSYAQYMPTNFFDRIEHGPSFIPNGAARTPQQVKDDCTYYEKLITKLGGIDLQLAGIGRSGHIGFNEPGSAADSRTRLVDLHPFTREDAAPDFGGMDKTPTQAITMGVGTIMDARRIVFMASGEKKAAIVAQALLEPPNSNIPATFLQNHPNVGYFLDQGAASGLKGSLLAPRGEFSNVQLLQHRAGPPGTS